jgi:pimeloyl-ACP methyl ester carboxylesterase
MTVPERWQFEPLLIIHGTFAQDSSWFRRQSNFCRALNEQLIKHGSAAECWSPLSNDAIEFRWSGGNSELERRLAGRHLLALLKKLESQDGLNSYHIVAHSHGGNVVLNALALLHPKKLKTVVFLGCPFIETKSRIVQRFLASTLIGLLITGIIIGISVFLGGIESLVLSDGFPWVIVLPCSWFAFALWNSFNTFVAIARRRRLASLQTECGYRCFVMSSKYDEAYMALTAALDVRRRLGELARRLVGRYSVFPDMEYWMFRWGGGFIFPDPIEGTNWVARISRGYQRLFNRVTIVANGAAFTPVLMMAYLVRLVGMRIALNAIASMAVGDDLSYERITSVFRQPENLKTTNIEIPTSLDDEMMQKASKTSSQIVHGIYESNSGAAAMNVAEFVRKSLSDPYVVHSQYYCEEQLIARMALAIANKL